LWARVPETAERLRGRIEAVLNSAKAKGLRSGENPARWSGENPARWRGYLALILPKRQRLTRGHHAALPYRDLPEFIKRRNVDAGVFAGPMAAGARDMSLPADGGTDPAKKERNPSDECFTAAAAPRNRILPTRSAAYFAEFPFDCLDGATTAALGAATKPPSTYAAKVLEQRSAESDRQRYLQAPWQEYSRREAYHRDLLFPDLYSPTSRSPCGGATGSNG
jgi:hypothetical protein